MSVKTVVSAAVACDDDLPSSSKGRKTGKKFKLPQNCIFKSSRHFATRQRKTQQIKKLPHKHHKLFP